MDERPYQPREDSAQAQAATLENGKVLTDHGHVAWVAIAEGLYNWAAPNPRTDDAPDEASLLNCDSCYAGQRMAVLSRGRRITDDKYLGVVGDAQLRPNAGTPGTIRADAELLDDRRGLNTRRPQHRLARDALAPNHHTVLIHLLDYHPDSHLDAELL